LEISDEAQEEEEEQSSEFSLEDLARTLKVCKNFRALDEPY
jgi:hypothetical protein